MAILAEHLQDNSEAESVAQQYQLLVNQFEFPAITFHSVQKEEDALARLSEESDCIFVGQVPVIAPIILAEDLNDVERCVRMVEEIDADVSNENIFASTVSAQAIVSNLNEIRSQRQKYPLYIYTEYDIGSSEEELLERGQEFGFKIHELVNSGTKTSAGLNFFEASTVITEKSPDEPITFTEVVDLGKVDRYVEQEDGSVLAIKKGGSFTQDEIDQLWHLFSKRFEDISENLPIRMEESYEATVTLFNNPDYVFSYNIETDGTISCAAFASDAREAYPWIKEDFLDKLDDEYAQSLGRAPYSIFVPGVAAYKKRGMTVSGRVLQNLVKCAALTGHDEVMFRFECTDVSSLYVPRIVEKVLRANPAVEFVEKRMLGQKKFVLLEVAALPNEEQ